MIPKAKRSDADEMRPEYDFSGAVRGKYYERYRAGTNVVLLDADVAEAFPTSENVNDALRVLMRVARGQVAHAKTQESLTQRSTRPRPRAGSAKHANTRLARGG